MGQTNGLLLFTESKGVQKGLTCGKAKKRKATQDASKTVRRAYLRKIDDCYFWKYKIFIATFIR